MDKPDGVIIYNNAKIHFDGFVPTFTNKTKHTVKKNFNNFIQTISTFNPEYQHVSVKIYPNPFSEMATISLEGEDFEELRFDLYDMIGQRIKSEKFSGNDFSFYRDGLSAGVYIFNISSSKGIIKAGRIVIQ
jgi:Secretion system C-terminal sorting domain